MKTGRKLRAKGAKPAKSTPRVGATRSSPGGPPPDAAPKKNGVLILLVEDDQDHRDALTHLLEGDGYEVVSANDGLQAMERMRWGLRPHAILLDMRMQVMNGWEFRRELGRDPACSGTPIVIMSGGSLRPKDLAGCADWISKPVHGPELLLKLERCTRPAMSIR